MLKKNARFIMVMSIVFAGTAFASDSLYVPKFKSPATGVEISVLSTIMPVAVGFAFSQYGSAVMILGPVFGPSVGHFYAHQWGAGCLGIGLRCALAGSIYLAANVANACSSNSDDMKTFVVICLTGAGLITLESIVEICSVPGSVRKYNEWLLKKNQINLMPEINFRKQSYGLKISYSF
jgi:MFS family permease